MSLDIDQIALHQLIKRDENQLELVLRDTLLPANATDSDLGGAARAAPAMSGSDDT